MLLATIFEEIREGLGRLGRHIEHDDQSRAFPAEAAPTPRTTAHLRHCPAYDQGARGSCVGNAVAGMAMTDPVWVPGRALTEADAVRLYSEATHRDGVVGVYPPTDTGSTGLGGMKAARAEGLIAGYRHAFGFSMLLGALTLRPGILGVNWYSSFDAPLPSGECGIAPGAFVRGGHEVQMFGLDMEQGRVWCYNSWGPAWGGRKDGTFWLSFTTLQRLLKERGDATFPA